MPELNSIVADRFRAVLAYRHISVIEYAELTKQSRDAANRRINGIIPLTLSDLHDFCEVTGYEPYELLQPEFVLKPVAHAMGSQALAGKEAE